MVGVPSSCALLGGFAIGARFSLLRQHSAQRQKSAFSQSMPSFFSVMILWLDYASHPISFLAQVRHLLHLYSITGSSDTAPWHLYVKQTFGPGWQTDSAGTGQCCSNQHMPHQLSTDCGHMASSQRNHISYTQVRERQTVTSHALLTLYQQNRIQALNQQILRFYPQIQFTDASCHIYIFYIYIYSSPQTTVNVKASLRA